MQFFSRYSNISPMQISAVCKLPLCMQMSMQMISISGRNDSIKRSTIGGEAFTWQSLSITVLHAAGAFLVTWLSLANRNDSIYGPPFLWKSPNLILILLPHLVLAFKLGLPLSCSTKIAHGYARRETWIEFSLAETQHWTLLVVDICVEKQKLNTRVVTPLAQHFCGDKSQQMLTKSKLIFLRDCKVR